MHTSSWMNWVYQLYKPAKYPENEIMIFSLLFLNKIISYKYNKNNICH